MHHVVVSLARLAAASCCVAVSVLAQAQQAALPDFPEGVDAPKGPTPAERTYEEQFPLLTPRGSTPPPTGVIRAPGEYEPMQGILLAWEGSATFTNILARMATHITTTGNADVYIMVDSAAEGTAAVSTIAALTAPAANMGRVFTFVIPTDTIWIRDYGPRYIYEGNVRAIVDHTYNRPARTLDNAQPLAWGPLKNHAVYEMPLIHGGGNYHLNGLSQGYATRLISNENPSLTEPQIVAMWQQYQGVTTLLGDAFPTSVDSTQHIDMWVQVAGDSKVMVSDWASPPVTNPNVDVLCDNFAAARAGEGWTVGRVPAFSVSGTHYTYTNVVICNNLVLVPSYTNTTVVNAGGNGAAIAAWQALRSDLPPQNIVPVACQGIVTSAGVMHCIVMHVPSPLGGTSPTVNLKTLRGPQTLQPGENADIRWATDDDAGVSSIDILLSTDGGATFPTVIAASTADDGQFTWTVPSTYTTQGRIRVVARDAQSNTGSDSSIGDLFINAPLPPCPGDADGDRDRDFADVTTVLANFGLAPGAFGPGDADGNGVVEFADITSVLASFGIACP